MDRKKKVVKKCNKKEKKVVDNMKVTVEDLYRWIDYAFESIESQEGKISIKNAWRGCGYFDSV